MFVPVCSGGTRHGRAGRYGIGPYMGCSRRRGVCGRGMPLPYMPSGNDRPNGIAAAARANVGRDALIPPGPAAAGMFPVLNFNGAAGVNARPTDPGKHGGQPGNATPAVHRRGGFHIRPVCGGAGFRGGINPALRANFVFQTNRAAAMFARFAGEGHAPPLHAVRERPAKWDCHGRPGERRAGCPHPAGPRGGGNVPGFEFQRCGGVNARPTAPGKHGGHPGKCNPRL